MVTTDYLAFGYKLCKVEMLPGDSTRQKCKKYVIGDWYLVDKDYDPNLTREDYENDNYTYNEIVLITSGKIEITPIHTMTPVFYTRGYSTIDSFFVKGMVKEEVVEPTTIFNVNPLDNLNMDPVMPKVSVLRWTAGSVIEPPVKFFLADGSFKKGNTVFSTTGAYSLTTGNIEITADCLGFVFND